jgi:hypothetical protein
VALRVSSCFDVTENEEELVLAEKGEALDNFRIQTIARKYYSQVATNSIEYYYAPLSLLICQLFSPNFLDYFWHIRLRYLWSKGRISTHVEDKAVRELAAAKKHELAKTEEFFDESAFFQDDFAVHVGRRKVEHLAHEVAEIVTVLLHEVVIAVPHGAHLPETLEEQGLRCK